MTRAEASNGKDKAPSVDDLADQIETLKSDLVTLTSLISELGSAESERAKEKIREKVDAARDKGAEHMADAQAHARQMGSEANEFLARQPALALGIAAGIGFLIGMLGSRK